MAVWESDVWSPLKETRLSGSWGFIFGFWLITLTILIPAIFLLSLIYAQSQNPTWKPFHKYYTKEALTYVMLLAGNWMFFGVLEDFGCYVIWGVDRFYELAPWFHRGLWIGGLPWIYWIIIPGIILIALSLYLRKKLGD